MENKNRSPIVTLMGHVDHGKTTLLDAIRKSNVAAREHGGITQHIGAYQINPNSQPITFVDTPGHAAFEKMRSRGAEVADIVILVVAANDGVKPQTVEAIKHIKKAQKPTIVAITKTDLPDINLDRIKKELQDQDIKLEEYGGDVPVVSVSATKGKGIDDLLEVINLVWQLSPEPSLANDPLQAVVVESSLDKNRGSVTTVIVKKGTLRVGQKIVVDNEPINVKALIDDNGKNIKEVLPGQPVEILGFKKTLDVGSIVGSSTQTQTTATKPPASLAEIIEKSQGAKERFKVIVKADVSGSLEAVLVNIPPEILVLSSGVGEVSQNDLALAKVSHAPILAFNIKVPNQIKSQAEAEGVIIRPYQVIYELLKDIEDVSAGFEEAKHELKILGRGRVIASFNIDGTRIAGVKVTQGKLKVGDQIILKSADVQKEAKIATLKRFKKDVEVVNNGQDCGIGFSPVLDFKEGDVLESLG